MEGKAFESHRYREITHTNNGSCELRYFRNTAPIVLISVGSPMAVPVPRSNLSNPE